MDANRAAYLQAFASQTAVAEYLMQVFPAAVRKKKLENTQPWKTRLVEAKRAAAALLNSLDPNMAEMPTWSQSAADWAAELKGTAAAKKEPAAKKAAKKTAKAPAKKAVKAKAVSKKAAKKPASKTTKKAAKAPAKKPAKSKSKTKAATKGKATTKKGKKK